MIIDKKSLHYRILNWLSQKLLGYDEFAPTTLCGYFWQAIGTLGFTTIILSGLLLGGYLMVYSPLLWYFTENPYNYQRGCAIVGLVLDGLLLTFFVVGFVYLYVKDRSFGKMIAAFFKAIKDKYCPIVTYKE